MFLDGVQKILGVVHGGHHVDVVLAEYQDDPVAQHGAVLRNDHSHRVSFGSVTVTVVGPCGGLSIVIVPSRARTRRSIPDRPVPAASTVAPPLPSSCTLSRIWSSASRRSMRACTALPHAWPRW